MNTASAEEVSGGKRSIQITRLDGLKMDRLQS